MRVIAPGAVIGIVGGGQLGRMMSIAAAELGYKTHIFCPEEDSPASQIAWRSTIATYADKQAIAEFAKQIDVATFEFENIPHESLSELASYVDVYPSPDLLKISQNRLREKNFINANDVATANYYKVNNQQELEQAINKIGVPAILKTNELGYDGKGQVKISSIDEAIAAWDKLHNVNCILEQVIDFKMEISVIVARGRNGQQACYVPVQNIHKNHILSTTIAPAPLSKELVIKARHIALTLAKAAKLQGILAVEMFVTKQDEILVNELAPRPHNSGHWTIDACVTSQFEQTIRAICGLALGSTERLCDAVMHNIIGNDIDEWEEHIKNAHSKLHLYGKSQARDGRKMGHVTIVKPI